MVERKKSVVTKIITHSFPSPIQLSHFKFVRNLHQTQPMKQRCRWEQINTFLRFKFKTPNQHSTWWKIVKHQNDSTQKKTFRIFPSMDCRWQMRCMFVILAESGLTCVTCLFGDVWQWIFLIWIWKPAIDCAFQSYSFHSDKMANKSQYSGAIESIRVAFHYRFRFINNIYIPGGNVWVMLALMNTTSKSNFSPCVHEPFVFQDL